MIAQVPGAPVQDRARCCGHAAQLAQLPGRPTVDD